MKSKTKYLTIQPLLLTMKKIMKIFISHRKRTAANRYIAITIVKSLFTRDPHAFFYIFSSSDISSIIQSTMHWVN